MVTSSAIVVRHLEAADWTAWLDLWRGYQSFYHWFISDELTALTFQRIPDPNEPVIGFVAVVNAQLVGFAHSIVTVSTWSTAPSIYLNDLFTSSGAKGSGVGRHLISAVYSEADQLGSGQVWWLTHEGNMRARRLYDRVAYRSGHIHYSRLPIGLQPGGETDP